MTLFDGVYSGKRVLVTGHTGFKGSWLVLWLRRLGAEVAGISLDMPGENHWAMLDMSRELICDHRADIREANRIAAIVRSVQPDIVFHLAAQPLVRRSYAVPLETWQVNVLGTANVLDASLASGSVRAVVAVTTDKVYLNREWVWSYREIDRLGGRDPYSASKAAAEMLVESYRESFARQANAPRLASARAGNVIGGGDWAEDRLVPDCVRAIAASRTLLVRSPNAVRPWQHVLDCLSGYLRLGQCLLTSPGFDEAWNFGPRPYDALTVSALLHRFQELWPDLAWASVSGTTLHESTRLSLDFSKAEQRLGWSPVWSSDIALKSTVDWYRSSSPVRQRSSEQLDAYLVSAARASSSWLTS